MMRTALLALLASLPAATVAAPEPAPAAEEVSIPFAGFNSIRTFRPVGDEILYLQDRRRDWYRATFAVPCLNIQSALRFGVDMRNGGRLDNGSTILVNGEACRIHSLVRSGPPPRRRR